MFEKKNYESYQKNKKVLEVMVPMINLEEEVPEEIEFWFYRMLGNILKSWKQKFINSTKIRRNYGISKIEE